MQHTQDYRDQARRAQPRYCAVDRRRKALLGRITPPEYPRKLPLILPSVRLLSSILFTPRKTPAECGSELMFHQQIRAFTDQKTLLAINQKSEKWSVPADEPLYSILDEVREGVPSQPIRRRHRRV